MIPDLARVIAAFLLAALTIIAATYAISWLAIKAIGEATDDGCGCGPDYCEACVEYAGDVEQDRSEHTRRDEL